MTTSNELPLRRTVRSQLLRIADRFFPPDPAARMTSMEQTEHEVSKANSSMGAYLAEIGRQDIDVLDFGAGWGGETLWLAHRVRSVAGVDADPLSVSRSKAAQHDMGI